MQRSAWRKIGAIALKCLGMGRPGKKGGGTGFLQGFSVKIEKKFDIIWIFHTHSFPPFFGGGDGFGGKQGVRDWFFPRPSHLYLHLWLLTHLGWNTRTTYCMITTWSSPVFLCNLSMQSAKYYCASESLVKRLSLNLDSLLLLQWTNKFILARHCHGLIPDSSDAQNEILAGRYLKVKILRG